MRFCTNCGERLNDEQAFCPNCGTAVKNAAVAPQPAVSFASPTDTPEKPKKRRGWLIAVICVAAVLLVAVLLVGYFLLGWFRAPHERLQNYLDKGSKLASVAIKEREVENEFSTDSTLSLDAADITLPAEIDTTIYYLFGMDAATLFNAVTLDLNIDTDMNDKAMLMEMALKLSGSAIMGYTMTVDEEGMGAFSSVTNDYVIAPWDSVGIPFPFDSSLTNEDLAEFVVEAADAIKLLLSKESVMFERGYQLVCGDEEEVRCDRYVICPTEDEWEAFLLAYADLFENNRVLGSLFNSANSGSDASAEDLARMFRDQAADVAAQCAALNAEVELYMKGALPVGVKASADDSQTDFEILFASHGGTSSGYRGVSVQVESYDEPTFSLELDNTYENENGVETGSVTGSLQMPGSYVSIDFDGDYEGESFDISADVTQDGAYTCPIRLTNECETQGDSKTGTLSLSVSAPQVDDGSFAFTIDYDYSEEEESVLHAPYGTFDLSLDLKNITYNYDEMLSQMRVTLTIEEGRGGGTDHRITVRGLEIDDSIRIGEASIILTTSNEVSSAKKPTVTPQYGDMSAFEGVITGGLPTGIW